MINIIKKLIIYFVCVIIGVFIALGLDLLVIYSIGNKAIRIILIIVITIGVSQIARYICILIGDKIK